MGMFLDGDDLAPFADVGVDKADAMIADVEATAQLVAPCIADLDNGSAKFLAVKAILRGVVLRWNDAGSGGITTTQDGAGPFQQMTVVDNSKTRRGAFWPSEIQQLQQVCAGSGPTRAFEVDTAPAGSGVRGSRTWVTPTDWVVP